MPDAGGDRAAKRHAGAEGGRLAAYDEGRLGLVNRLDGRRRCRRPGAYQW